MGTGGGLVVIDFSEQGNSAYFRRDGWSGQESDRVWGIGPRSVLVVPIQSSGRSIVMEAEIAPYSGQRCGDRRCTSQFPNDGPM
jgi:hypothetical protein